MAKKTCLQLLNRVLEKIGEPEVTVLTSLSGRNLMSWNALNEALYEIYTNNSGKWQFAESSGTITLLTSTTAYAVATDMMEEDIFSFRLSANSTNIAYVDPQEFDIDNPSISNTGYPTQVTKYNNQFVIDTIPGSANASKTIQYRYWKIPTVFSTATSTTTCDIPEIFEEAVVVNLAVYKVLAYEGDSEAQRYYIELYGGIAGGDKKEGSFNRMKRIYGSSKLDKIRVTYNF